jgi:hypothetical protein
MGGVVDWRSFFPVFCSASLQPTPSARVPHTIHQSTQCRSKDVPFGGFIDTSHLMGELSPQNPSFRYVNRDFQLMNVYGRISAKKKRIITIDDWKCASRQCIKFSIRKVEYEVISRVKFTLFCKTVQWRFQAKTPCWITFQQFNRFSLTVYKIWSWSASLGIWINQKCFKFRSRGATGNFRKNYVPLTFQPFNGLPATYRSIQLGKWKNVRTWKMFHILLLGSSPGILMKNTPAITFQPFSWFPQAVYTNRFSSTTIWKCMAKNLHISF